MRKEYVLREGRGNPYAEKIGSAGRTVLLEQLLRSEHFVRLDGDVAEAFHDDAAVNEALRLVLRMKGLAIGPRKRSPRAARPRRTGS